MNYLGIDLGGTNITAAVLNDDFKIISEAKRKTACPRPYQAILDDVAAAALEAAEKAGIPLSDFDCAGVGSPGIISVETGVVIDAVNLGFKNVPLKEYVEKKLGIPVLLENDANAAAFGEFLAGAAKGTSSFVAFTIGTGIGSGVVIENRLFRGANNIAGELGHSTIALNGRPCSCGRKGCMDVYASATGLITTTKEFMSQHTDSLMWQLVQGDINQVNGTTAFTAFKAGDDAAKKAVESYLYALGSCIVNIINIFQPDMITIAGGVSKEGETLLAPIRAQAQAECLKNPQKPLPVICIAALQDKAGVIGAALLGKQI